MGTPDYERVAAEITRRIETGEWPPGHQLPRILDLAAEYGTGQTTIKNAFMMLRQRGLIRGQQGKGVFVADRPQRG
jgi:GntR family transcriptional regulator